MAVLTLANQLTILRVLLVPAFVLLMVYGYLGGSLLVFLRAGVTDMLDGIIARCAHQRTNLGAWLDPFWLTVLIISRDIVIVAVVAVVNLAVGQRTFRPSLCGKLTTGTYIFTSIAFLYFNYLHQTSWIIDIMIWLSLCMTFISGGDYYFRMRKLINDPS